MLSNTTIVDDLAHKQTIEQIIKNLNKTTHLSSIEKDLCQDLYICLLELDTNLINKLYKNNELRYYIVGMVKNNLFSTSSHYYNQYRKFSINSSDIADFRNI